MKNPARGSDVDPQIIHPLLLIDKFKTENLKMFKFHFKIDFAHLSDDKQNWGLVGGKLKSE